MERRKFVVFNGIRNFKVGWVFIKLRIFSWINFVWVFTRSLPAIIVHKKYLMAGYVLEILTHCTKMINVALNQCFEILKLSEQSSIEMPNLKLDHKSHFRKLRIGQILTYLHYLSGQCCLLLLLLRRFHLLLSTVRPVCFIPGGPLTMEQKEHWRESHGIRHHT